MSSRADALPDPGTVRCARRRRTVRRHSRHRRDGPDLIHKLCRTGITGAETVTSMVFGTIAMAVATPAGRRQVDGLRRRPASTAPPRRTARSTARRSPALFSSDHASRPTVANGYAVWTAVKPRLPREQRHTAAQLTPVVGSRGLASIGSDSRSRQKVRPRAPRWAAWATATTTR